MPSTPFLISNKTNLYNKKCKYIIIIYYLFWILGFPKVKCLWRQQRVKCFSKIDPSVIS